MKSKHRHHKELQKLLFGEFYFSYKLVEVLKLKRDETTSSYAVCMHKYHHTTQYILLVHT